MSLIAANGKPVAAMLPCTLEQFLVAQKLLSRRSKVALAASGAAA